MRNLTKVVWLAFVLTVFGLSSGCVYVPARGGYWVPGHWAARDVWVPGHYR